MISHFSSIWEKCFGAMKRVWKIRFLLHFSSFRPSVFCPNKRNYRNGICFFLLSSVNFPQSKQRVSLYESLSCFTSSQVHAFVLLGQMEPEVKFQSIGIISSDFGEINTPLPVDDNRSGQLLFTLKEGSQYQFKLTFNVLHNIVSGLTYSNTVWKGGLQGAESCSFLYLFIYLFLTLWL